MSERPNTRGHRVAVVIAFFNGSDFLEDAITSISRQTVIAHKVIVVDDGSCDIERERLAKLQKVYKFEIITTSNGGMSRARNLGAARLTGIDYVCFLDQDDTFLPDHIEKLLEFAPPTGKESDRGAVIFGSMWSTNRNLEILDRTSMGIKSHLARATLNDWLGSDTNIVPSSAMISFHAFQSCGGFDEELIGFEDDDLWLRLWLAGADFIPVNSAVGLYRRHSQNSYKSSKMLKSGIYFYEKYDLFCVKNFGSNSYERKNLARRFRAYFAAALLNSMELDSNLKNLVTLKYLDALENHLSGFWKLVFTWVGPLARSEIGLRLVQFAALLMPIIRRGAL